MKKMIWTVVVVLAAAIALIWGLKRAGIIGGAKPPAWVDNELIEKIDLGNGEVMTRPLASWRKLGNEVGRYKNPKTGEYTMVTPMVCPNCQARIPVPDPPDAIWSYKCPKCGKPVTQGAP